MADAIDLLPNAALFVLHPPSRPPALRGCVGVGGRAGRGGGGGGGGDWSDESDEDEGVEVSALIEEG